MIKIRKNKKGQLMIQEMAFVLLAVIFLFGLVLLIFTSIQSRQLQKYAIQSREARAITFLEVVSALPELRCSSSFSSTSEAVCVDKDKLAFFNSSISIQEKYAVLWRNALISKIEVQEVYPVDLYPLIERVFIRKKLLGYRYPDHSHFCAGLHL